jgi:tetratricopeptide (TPR) repeat protein
MLLSGLARAQDPALDSLKLLLKNAADDTTRCKLLSALAENAGEEEWPAYNRQLLDLASAKLATHKPGSPLRSFYAKHETAALSNFGILEYNKGNYAKAMELYQKSLKIEMELDYKRGMAGTYNNMALIYQAQGDIPKALEYNSRSLKLREALGIPADVANSLNNLGLIYDSQGDHAKAIEYFTRCLKICEELDFKRGITYALNNIGYSYQNMNQYPKALTYQLRSLEILEKSDDRMACAYALSNIGVFYSNYGNPDVTDSKSASQKAGNQKALEYFFKSLRIREEIGDKNGQAQSLSLIANAYSDLNDYQKALVNGKKSMALALETGIPKNILAAAGNLHKIYKATGNHRLSLENYELFVRMRDSLLNETTKKASIRQQLHYEYEKQAAADSVAHAKEKEITNAQLEKQKAEIRARRNQQYALFGGLALVIIFSGFMYNRFKITQKQKYIIQEQKSLVEEKQKEILDSIHYARRIQRAHLPTDKFISKSIERLRNDEC